MYENHNFFLNLFSVFSVSGLGFGIISGAFSLVNVLADMSGPGTIGIHGDSQYFFLASGKVILMMPKTVFCC